MPGGGNNNPTGKGGWKKGKSGNPKGRPKGSQSRDPKYREILLGTCSYEDWLKIVQRAVIDAKLGNASARNWLSGYLVGTPRQHVELTGLNGGALDVDATFMLFLDKIYGSLHASTPRDASVTDDPNIASPP